MIEHLRTILDRPFFYDFYHLLIGANYRSGVLVRDYIRPRPGIRILDLGCGPGRMIRFLPDCLYVGVDANAAYIISAQKRYGRRGEFICQRASHYAVQQLGAFDIVLALGLVHHLNDLEAQDLFRAGRAALKLAGRMITNDGCYVPGQSFAERYLLSHDRGRFVRTQEQYLELAGGSFSQVTPHLREDLLRIPYTHLIMECVR